MEEILLPEKAIAGVVCLTKLAPTGFEGKLGCSMTKVKPGVMT